MCIFKTRIWQVTMHTIVKGISLVPRLSWNANMYRLHNFNVRVPEHGSLGMRLKRDIGS